MTFSIVDIVIIIILGVFAWRGYKKGLIESLASFLGLTIGLYASYKLYVVVGDWVAWWTGWGKSFCRVLVFVLLFVLLNWLINYLCYLADRFLQLLYKIPLVHKLSDLLGAFFTLLEGVVVLSILILLTMYIPWKNPLKEPVKNSIAASYVSKSASYVLPFIPKVFKNLM
jgi:membrane protein required for colicin V production